DRLDLPGQITTQNTMLWCAESVPREADGKARQAPQEVPITRIGGGGADAYQYFIVPGCRLVDFPEFENVRRTVAVADDCLHGRTAGTGWARLSLHCCRGHVGGPSGNCLRRKLYTYGVSLSSLTTPCRHRLTSYVRVPDMWR